MEDCRKEIDRNLDIGREKRIEYLVCWTRNSGEGMGEGRLR